MLGKGSLLGAIGIAVSLCATLPGQASSTAGLRVSLVSTGHSVRAGAPWTYTIRAKNSAGKPIAAVATVGARGGKQSVRRFVGTTRRTITWPNAGLYLFRATVRAGSLSRTLSYRVTVTAPPSAGPSTGTQQSPVPLGRVGTLTDSTGATWRMAVGIVTPNATQQVLAASPSNQPPASGRQFFMLYITLTYAGGGLEPGLARAAGAGRVRDDLHRRARPVRRAACTGVPARQSCEEVRVRNDGCREHLLRGALLRCAVAPALQLRGRRAELVRPPPLTSQERS